MARRLHQTMADYVVIAISPALIMALVGSLVFFLLQVLYRGEFAARLNWVMACFVFAAVLIGRISIEEGFERAAPFGIALAIVVGIALNRFVEVHGFWIESLSSLINYALLGLVWWCAHRLTWDCTLVDDSQDASGEGLLQTAGLERGGDEEPKTERPEPSIEGTTLRSNIPVGWWQQHVERQRRPHAPGVWVVYFSLAALPLFGIGQWFIPAGNLAGRRYAFWLLLVYVASGLGLLLTTSFLGLRRYLRQRRIEMPTLMANLWLGMGASLILVLLVFAAMLPRPSAEYAIAQLPFEVGSPEQRASRAAPVPKEGARDKQPGSASAPQPKQDPQPSKGESNPQPAETNQASGSQLESSATQQPEPDSSRSGQGGQNQRRPDSSSGRSQPSEQPPQSPQASDSQSSQSNDQKGSQPIGPQRQPPAGQAPLAELLQKLKEQQEQRPKPAEAQRPSETQPQTPRSQAPAPKAVPQIEPDAILEPVVSSVAEMVKWAFYAMVILGALFALWRYRAEVGSSIRGFFAGLRDLLNGLWGRKRRVRIGPSAEEIFAELPPPPFSSYADPFARGIASRYSMEELVRYSFEAFEAWARERGCPRHPDQTPHELARRVGARVAAIAPDARNLAELYARAAYDRGTLPPASGEQLQQLWRHMRPGAARSLGN